MTAPEGPDFGPAYTVTIQPQEDGAGFIARVPDLPGCMCVGKTAHGRADLGHGRDRGLDQGSQGGRPVPSPTRSKGPSGRPSDLPALLNKLFDLQ